MKMVLTRSYSNDDTILLQLTSLPALITNWAQGFGSTFHLTFEFRFCQVSLFSGTVNER